MLDSHKIDLPSGVWTLIPMGSTVLHLLGADGSKVEVKLSQQSDGYLVVDDENPILNLQQDVYARPVNLNSSTSLIVAKD